MWQQKRCAGETTDLEQSDAGYDVWRVAVVGARGIVMTVVVRGQGAGPQVKKAIANRRSGSAQQASESDGNNDLARESVGGHNE